jgi:serine protease Do
MALGSGFIADPAGDIVTNNHVVANADEVRVIFKDNSRRTVKVIGCDEKADIALLEIDDNQKLPYVTWGNNDVAKVGDGRGRQSLRSRLGDRRYHLRTRARHQ